MAAGEASVDICSLLGPTGVVCVRRMHWLHGCNGVDFPWAAWPRAGKANGRGAGGLADGKEGSR